MPGRRGEEERADSGHTQGSLAAAGQRDAPQLERQASHPHPMKPLGMRDGHGHRTDICYRMCSLSSERCSAHSRQEQLSWQSGISISLGLLCAHTISLALPCASGTLMLAHVQQQLLSRSE